MCKIDCEKSALFQVDPGLLLETQTQKAPTATAVQWTVAEWRGHLGGATIRLHP